MFCPKCGKNRDENFKFCMNCGFKFDDGLSQEANTIQIENVTNEIPIPDPIIVRPKRKKKKALVISISIILALIVIAGAAFLVYNMFFNDYTLVYTDGKIIEVNSVAVYHYDDKIYIADKNSDKDKVLVDDADPEFAFDGKYVFYTNNDKLYKVNVKNKKSEQIKPDAKYEDKLAINNTHQNYLELVFDVDGNLNYKYYLYNVKDESGFSFDRYNFYKENGKIKYPDEIEYNIILGIYNDEIYYHQLKHPNTVTNSLGDQSASIYKSDFNGKNKEELLEFEPYHPMAIPLLAYKRMTIFKSELYYYDYDEDDETYMLCSLSLDNGDKITLKEDIHNIIEIKSEYYRYQNFDDNDTSYIEFYDGRKYSFEKINIAASLNDYIIINNEDFEYTVIYEHKVSEPFKLDEEARIYGFADGKIYYSLNEKMHKKDVVFK